MVELTNYKSYQEYKKELDGELRRAAEGFVRIGYLLRMARDTNVLAESGYESVNEFAYKEYGLDKSQVSRFISINERFARGGESLLPEYEEYGYAKLTIMLQIPEEITQELTPEYSKAEIQAVKEELDEEKKVSDLEVLMEGQKDEEETILYRTLKQLGHDDPDLWERLWNVRVPFMTWNEIGNILAPSGDKVYSVRIMGAGRMMMTMKDGEDSLTITNTRTFEKEVVTKQKVANEFARILVDAETAADAWEKVYLETWPKWKVAPVQPENPHIDSTRPKQTKKESKVSKAKKPEKPKKISTEPVSAAVEEEAQLPGQMSLEDYPEIMPEEGEKNGAPDGLDEGNDQNGLPDCAGDADTDGGSADVPGDAVQGNDAGTGTSEGRGRKSDHEGHKEDHGNEVMEPFWDALEQIGSALDYMDERFPEEDFDDNLAAMTMEKMEEAYREALKLAAGFEKLMIWRRQNHEG